MSADSIDTRRTGSPARPGRPTSPAARRFGYGVAVLVNLLLLWLANVWPGWQVLPFLDDRFVEVLPWVNASLAVGAVANLVNLIFDRRWVRAIGDLVSTFVGLLSLIVMWNVFPFDFGGTTFPWEAVVRTLLVIAIGGSAIAIVVAIVTLVRAVVGDDDHAAPPSRT